MEVWEDANWNDLADDERTGYWRKLHNEELQNLYRSPSIIRMIKSKGMHVGNWREFRRKETTRKAKT
jgi:hypothetical protein